MTEQAKIRQKTCNDCGFVGPADTFVLGRRVCLKCQAERQSKSRGLAGKKLVVGAAGKASAKVAATKAAAGKAAKKPASAGKKPAAKAKAKGAGGKRAPRKKKLVLDIGRTALESFSSREGLSELLKANLAQSVDDANTLVTFTKARLMAAEASEDSRLINEANKALSDAMQHRSQLTTRLMEKLEAMEDLRAAQEKAKPVTFIFVEAPVEARLLPTREVPEED